MDIQKLYSKKTQILRELLTYVKSKKFTGAEADISRYEKYVNKKETYISKMKEIDDIINRSGDGAETVTPEMRELAGQISDADNKISDIMSGLFEELKVKSKNSKLAQKMNMGYNVGRNVERRSVFDLRS